MRATQRIEEVRIGDLERRLDSLESRIERLESKARFLEESDEEAIEPAILPALGTEYWLGARLIPRLGAVLIILAIAFLAISESAKSSSINKGALLALEAVVCFGFIAFGEWRRNELEGFGMTLAAIGSCGLYLTAAGGHFAYHALSAAAMAAGFAVLSLLNHAYAVWRNTRLFFFIGASGGLAAMLFPLSEKDYGTGLAVYTVVTIGGALVCAARKWRLLAMVGWLMGLAVLYPVVDSAFPRVPVIVALYLGSLACIGAYIRAIDERNLEIEAIGAALALFATALFGFGVLPGIEGVLHLSLFAGLVYALPLVARVHPRVARFIQIGAAATAAALIPLCFPLSWTVLSFAAIAVLAWLIGRRIGAPLSAAFSLAASLGAAAAYAAWIRTAAGMEETILLAGMSLAALGSAKALQRADFGATSFAVAASWILLARWTSVLTSRMELDLELVSPLTIFSVVFALGLLFLGFRRRSGTLRLWSMAVMLVSVFQILIVESGVAVGFRLGSLAVLGFLMLMAGYRYVLDRR